MAGLLDFTSDPQGMQGMALLAAAAPSMTPMNFAGRLAQAGSTYQGLLGDKLKQQDLSQQIQLRNLQLQQQQQEWAAIQPALAAYVARSGGAQPSQQAASAPAIPPSAGGPLGSGTFGIPMGGQDASAPAQPAQQGAARDPFGIDNIVQGKVISMLGGAPAGAAFFDSLKLPDAVKTNNYYGLDPADVRAAMQRETAAKGQMLVRQGSTLGRTNADGTFVPMFTAPDTKDNANITWVNGRPQSEQIPGLTAGIESVVRARKVGEAPYDNPVSIPTSDGRTLSLSKPEYAEYQRTGALPSRYSQTPGLVPSPASSAPPPSMDRAQFNNNPQVRQMAAAQPDGAMVLKTEYGGDPAMVHADIQKITQAIAQAKGNPTVQGILQGRLNTLNAAALAAGGSPAPVATPTPAAGPIVGMTAPLGAPKGAELSQSELSDKGKTLMADNSNTNTVISRLQNIKMLTPGAINGAESGRRDFFNGLLSLAGIQGATDAKTASDLVDKNSAQIVSALRLGQGGAGTDALQTLLGAANPSRHMTKEAVIEAADQLIASQKMIQAKAQLLQPQYLGRDPVAYGAKELQFDTNADPRVWQWRAITDPQQKKAFAARVMQSDPTFPAKIQALEKMGALK